MKSNKLAAPLRTALIVMALAGLALPAQAAQPTPAAVSMAKEILALKGGNEMFRPIVANIITRVKNTFLQTNFNLQKDLDAVALKLAGEYNPRIAEVTGHAAQLYASHFSEKELNQLVKFYRSPLGKKVIVTEPRVLEQSLAFANQWAGKLSQEILARFRVEMRKRGHNL
jgi:uncharacterized protein